MHYTEPFFQPALYPVARSCPSAASESAGTTMTSMHGTGQQKRTYHSPPLRLLLAILLRTADEMHSFASKSNSTGREIGLDMYMDFVFSACVFSQR